VMHKAVGGCVVTEEQGGVEGCAQPEQGPGAVDQFMGGRMADLAEPQTRRHEKADAVRQGQRTGAGDGKGEQRQGCEGEKPEGHKQGFGQGKFAVRRGARNPGGQKVEGHGGGGHVEDCKQGPDPAKRGPQGEQGQGAGGGKGEKADGQGAHGADIARLGRPSQMLCLLRAVIWRSGVPPRCFEVACAAVPLVLRWGLTMRHGLFCKGGAG
jgi:hypothetical protein